MAGAVFKIKSNEQDRIFNPEFKQQLRSGDSNRGHRADLYPHRKNKSMTYIIHVWIVLVVILIGLVIYSYKYHND